MAPPQAPFVVSMAGQGAVETPRGSEFSAIEPPMSGGAAGSGLQRPAGVVEDVELAGAQALRDAEVYSQLADDAAMAQAQSANRLMAQASSASPGSPPN